MSAAAKGRPPFRADHVGSLLRPAALRQAFRRHAAKEIGDAEFTATCRTNASATWLRCRSRSGSRW